MTWFPDAAPLVVRLFAPGASFAIAHTSREVMAKAQSGTNPSGRTSRIERGTCNDADRTGNPTGRP
ncbi:hypothetical protein NGM37_46660, partial [Streptomyces sp. TRM76130]|nr:hypothetical protein [Streptomyces sp. TRM76130]